jgi:ABC-type multidrug transport system fused ATPase/permease subunit
MVQSMGSLQSRSYALGVLYSDLKEIERFRKENPTLFRLLPEHGANASTASAAPSPFDSVIELDKLTYAYPNASKAAVKEVSLKIHKGESVALVGRSGSGKTTLVDIFLGLLTPQSGDIKVDDVSIYKNLRGWQDKLGYIPQSIFLLDDTIKHNVAFGVPHHLIDPKKVWTAIELAQLKEFVDNLPQGIETSVGERGVMLSGGQRQRIGIARALYHDCDILVLDEATSALDTETENLISEAISSLAGDKTLVVIAHRYSTIKDCDTVYRLEAGQIIQSGTYEEVVLAGQS